MNTIDKAKVLANSIVTYATFAAFAITVTLAQIQAAGVLPDNWIEPVVTYGGTAVAVLTAIVTIVKRVMPVPADGIVVVEPGTGVPVVAQRGWEPPTTIAVPPPPAPVV